MGLQRETAVGFKSAAAALTPLILPFLLFVMYSALILRHPSLNSHSATACRVLFHMWTINTFLSFTGSTA